MNYKETKFYLSHSTFTDSINKLLDSDVQKEFLLFGSIPVEFSNSIPKDMIVFASENKIKQIILIKDDCIKIIKLKKEDLWGTQRDAEELLKNVLNRAKNARQENK